MELTQKWWKEVTAYQIYPRSFMDSNGDGIGDLRGIIQKLDYLQFLGVDVVWLCPMYKSPQDDNGYDVSDYQDIQPEFGTMADFDELLEAMHARGMKLIIDLVVNHTSDEHPWFIESRGDRNNPKRDWYIWRDPKDGHEPNNWESIFGGSAWQRDEKTLQYYMHLFSIKQPDLNWDNMEMREAVYAMIRWWLDKGIDGFRIDAISHVKKEPGLSDLPNPMKLHYVPSFPKHMNVPGLQEYVTDLCAKTFSQYDIMTVGEANGVSAEQAPEWVDEKQNKLNMLFQFEHTGLWDTNPENKIDLLKVKEVFQRWQTGLQGRGWNALYVENHDIPRIVSKWGDPEKFPVQSATAIASFYFLMQGTPFIYQGQELGMANTQFTSLDDFNDVLARNTITEKRREGLSDAQIIAELAPVSRDNARTPMPWSADANAGFTRGRPWLKPNPSFATVNVEAQKKDPHSVLNFYRQLIALRKKEKTLIYGDFELVLKEHKQIFAYKRNWHGETVLVLVNLTGKNAPLDLPGEKPARLLLANRAEPASWTELRPYEARVHRY